MLCVKKINKKLLLKKKKRKQSTSLLVLEWFKSYYTTGPLNA